jgi:hypothetical protein
MDDFLKVDSSIRMINLSSNENQTTKEESIDQELIVYSSLKEINLSNNNIQSTGAISFAEALKVLFYYKC